MPSKLSIKIFLFFLLLAGTLFFPMLSGKVVLANWDRTMMGLPSHIFAARMLKGGTFPLWNPFLLCGYNYCSSGQFHLFNPAYFLAYLLPQAWLLHCLAFLAYLKFALSGFFTYLFVERLVKSRFWAVITGVMYMFSGSSIAMLTLVDMGTTHAMFIFPLLLYLAALLCEESRLTVWIFFSLVTALLFLGGMLHLCIFALGITILFYVWHSFFLTQNRIRKRAFFTLKKLIILGSAATVGVLIASIRILPFLYAFNLSARSDMTSAGEMAKWVHETAVPALGMLRMLMPEFFGYQLSGFFMWDTSGGHLNHIETFPHYVSIAGLFLSCLGISHLNKKTAIWALFILGMLLCTVNSPFSIYLERYILHGKRVLLCRFSLMLPMCLAVLAGYGGLYLQELPRRSLKALWCIFIPLSFAGAVFFYFKYPSLSSVHMLNRTISLQLVSLIYAAFFLCLILALSILYRFINMPKKAFAALLFTALFLDILMVAYADSNNSQRFMDYAPLALQKIPSIDSAKERVPPYEYRVYQAGERFNFQGNSVYPFSLSTITGLSDATGGEAFCYKRYAEFMSYPCEPYFRGIYDLLIYPRRVVLLGIINNMYPFLPRAGLYDKYTVTQKDRVLDTLFSEGFDPHNEIILEEDPGIAPGEGRAKGAARIVNYKCNSVEVETAADHKSILLLLDRNEEGWQAMVDGRKAKIYFADYIWRGVVVPEGTHRVFFSYFPPALARGIIFSGIGMIVIVIAGAIAIMGRSL